MSLAKIFNMGISQIMVSCLKVMQEQSQSLLTVSLPIITNVKCHFKPKSTTKALQDLKFTAKKQVGKSFHNFYVLRQNGLVYVIFPSGQHVNISGIRSLGEEVDRAKDTFCELLSEPSEGIPVIVDNITAVCSINSTRVNLVKLKEEVEKLTKKSTTVSLRPYSFPSAVLRTKKLPTLQVFSSGKVVIVGGKTIQEILLAHQTLCVLIRHL